LSEFFFGILLTFSALAVSSKEEHATRKAWLRHREARKMGSLIHGCRSARTLRVATWAMSAAIAAGCGGAESQPEAERAAASEAVTAPVVITSALHLSASRVASGETLSASVTYKNPGTRAVTLGAIVIAGRPPGGTHGGGPYDDFAPTQKNVTVAAGASLTVSASRAFTAADPLGTWESYPTYKDASGVWHDGPGVTFTVAPAYDGVRAAYPHAFVDSAGRVVRPRGFNVREVVYPKTNWTYSQANFATVKAAGFDTLRFALNWPDFEPTQGGWNATAWTLLSTALANAKAAGLNVILDPNHLKAEGNTPTWATGADSIEKTQRFAAPYLVKMAALVKAMPHVIAIDLTNEPYQKTLNQNRTLAMYETLIRAVRAVDANKILVLEPTWGNSSWKGADFSILTDRSNLVMSLHDYFAGGDDDGYGPTGLPAGYEVWDGTSGYPSPNRVQVENHVKVNLDILATIQMPLYIGEFGIGDGVANHDQWIQDHVSVYDVYGLSFTLWEWHSSGSMSATSGFAYKPWVPLLLQ
jgi:hypothetical protein